MDIMQGELHGAVKGVISLGKSYFYVYNKAGNFVPFLVRFFLWVF